MSSPVERETRTRCRRRRRTRNQGGGRRTGRKNPATSRRDNPNTHTGVTPSRRVPDHGGNSATDQPSTRRAMCGCLPAIPQQGGAREVPPRCGEWPRGRPHQRPQQTERRRDARRLGGGICRARRRATPPRGPGTGVGTGAKPLEPGTHTHCGPFWGPTSGNAHVWGAGGRNGRGPHWRSGENPSQHGSPTAGRSGFRLERASARESSCDNWDFRNWI